MDYLAATKIGVTAEIEVLRELAGGAYHLATIDPDQLVTAADLVERYRDQAIGLADASLVVLADRFRTRTSTSLVSVKVLPSAEPNTSSRRTPSWRHSASMSARWASVSSCTTTSNAEIMSLRAGREPTAAPGPK